MYSLYISRLSLQLTPNLARALINLYMTIKRLFLMYKTYVHKGATTVLKLGGPSAQGASRGAEGDGAWGGGAPLPTGEGLGRAVPCVIGH